jgi:carboxyl-terminal processing protease
MKYATLAATAIVAFGLGISTAVMPTAVAQDEDNKSTYEYLNLFGEVFEKVRAGYVEEVSDKELIESAINGMLTSLDPHSSYLDAKAFKDMQVQTRGEFGGLGIEVTMEDGYVKVVSPIDDTPAFRAGVKPGDYITHIDGESVLGLTLSDAVERMRGKVNTDIVITVRREGREPFDITITRDVIRIKSVRSRAEQNIGYIRITTFSEQTQKGLEDAIDSLKEEIGEDEIAGYVIDLRNNPGGLLDQAISVADTFLDKGEIVSTRARDPKDNDNAFATPGDLAEGKPIVVLINGGSASASEIVAGALQDHRRALVLGTQSFGKGSVQRIIALSGSGGAMRLTTSRYYTPSGTSIQGTGITPDVEVPVAKLEVVKPALRRSEADLRGALENDAERKVEDNGERSEQAAEDYQLMRALDAVRLLALDRTRREG